jgi:hypothetical protein
MKFNNFKDKSIGEKLLVKLIKNYDRGIAKPPPLKERKISNLC